MEVGVVGKPNVGKSTLFNALTLLDVPMAPFPFTTVKPHRGVGAVRFPCPHVEKGVSCTPGNAPCRDGVRWVPVSLIDVPGLVPGASAGKGLGHQFLDDLRTANGFLQVVDATGATTAEGILVAPDTTDPAVEVGWLEDELAAWVQEIITRDLERQARRVELEGAHAEDFVQQKLSGLAVAPSAVTQALRESNIDPGHPSRWKQQDIRQLARSILRVAKPRLVAANKCDRARPEMVAVLQEKVAPIPVVATSAEAELTLRRANRAGLIRYRPGDASFESASEGRPTPAQERALHDVRRILDRWGTTGVQRALESLVFDRLNQMVVFPVEDEEKWTDSKGRVLPDAYIVPTGTPARAVAYRVHSELGEGFIRAVDGRTHRVLGADHALSPGSVVRIVARR